jgi:hypothetical protein
LGFFFRGRVAEGIKTDCAQLKNLKPVEGVNILLNAKGKERT